MGLLGRARTGARRSWRHLRPGAAILMYHRIARAPVDPWNLCVSPTHFAEQLSMLRRYGTVLPLRTLVRRAREGNLPRRAVAITFDDGYADNLLHALPLLEAYDLPATFFLTAGPISEGELFWWDLLERIFLHPGPLPRQLQIRIREEQFSWSLGAEAHFSCLAAKHHRDWNAEQPPTLLRQRIFLTLWERLVHLPDEVRRDRIEELRSWAGRGRTKDTGHRLLTREELRTLAASSQTEIGAHTLTHPMLDLLPAADQYREVVEGKRRLEALVGQSVHTLSYPHGRYDETTKTIVRDAGFEAACTTIGDRVPRQPDLLTLPRLHVHDVSGYDLERQLHAIVG